jgi:voltage-gated potassium channel
MPDPVQPRQPERLTHLSRRDRRSALLRSLAAVAALDVGLFLVYANVPIDDARGATPIVMFALMLVIFAGVVMWQIHAIVNARLPAVRAASGIAFAIPVYLVLTSMTYLAMAAGNPASFSEPLNRVDALYFSMTVFASVGFGDITATTSPTRIAVTVQMVLNLIVIGTVVKVLIGAARAALQKANPADDSPSAQASERPDS